MLVVPALAFVDGGMTLWLAGSVFLGAVLSWTVLARRLRRYTFAAENSLTISEFLEKRVRRPHRVLRSLVAAVTLFLRHHLHLVRPGGRVEAARRDVRSGAQRGIVVTLVAVASYTLVGDSWRCPGPTCSSRC